MASQDVGVGPYTRSQISRAEACVKDCTEEWGFGGETWASDAEDTVGNDTVFALFVAIVSDVVRVVVVAVVVVVCGVGGVVQSAHQRLTCSGPGVGTQLTRGAVLAKRERRDDPSQSERV